MAIAGAGTIPRAARPRMGAWQAISRILLTKRRAPAAAQDRTPHVRSIFSTLSLGYPEKDVRWAGRMLRMFRPEEIRQVALEHSKNHNNLPRVIRALRHAGGWLWKNPHADYILPRLLENSPWTFGHQQAWKRAAKRDSRLRRTLLESDNPQVAARALYLVHSLGEVIGGEELQAALEKQGADGVLAKAISTMPDRSWTSKFLEPGFDWEKSRDRIFWSMGQG